MPEKLQGEKWYLAEIKAVRQSANGSSPLVYVLFEIALGPAVGTELPDTFYLTPRAISRFECLAHRAGCEIEIKMPEQADAKVLSAILRKKVWLRTKVDARDARVIRTDGWNFRPETDPPEDEVSIDYKKRDEWEIAMEGL